MLPCLKKKWSSRIIKERRKTETEMETEKMPMALRPLKKM